MRRDEFYNRDENEEYDEYSRMYEQQLRRYSAMDGKRYDDTLEFSDLEFHDEEEGYDDYDYDEYEPPQPVRRPSRPSIDYYPQRQRPAQQRSRQPQRRREDLEFGYNNPKKKRRYDDYDDYDDRDYVKPKRRKKKKKSPIKRFFKILIFLIIALFVVFELLIHKYVGMVNTVETGNRFVTNASMYDDDVMNVLVIGSDARSLEESGRTDSMILLSVNKNTKQITMTSFMRDMYVEIPNNGWNKMNAANVYGGPELLMDTIEQNFDVRVDKYVYFNFYSFIDIVDAVGGIEVEVSTEEVIGMQEPMAEQNDILGNKRGTDYLYEGGNLTLNGNQALAYARLRYVGNADFERTERQRIVITKIMEKAVTFNPFKLNKIASACASGITTNMSEMEMQLLINKLPFMLKYETEELRIPEDNMYSYGNHNGQSTLDVDFGAAQQAIWETIFN